MNHASNIARIEGLEPPIAAPWLQPDRHFITRSTDGSVELSDELARVLVTERSYYRWPKKATPQESQQRIIVLEDKAARALKKDSTDAIWQGVCDVSQWGGNRAPSQRKLKNMPEEEREESKALLVNFRNIYGFLSQVIPYQDSDLEQLYTYIRFLLTKLPKRDTGPAYHLDDEVELQYYRLQKISEGQIDLNTGEGQPLKGPSDVGTGQGDEEIKLSELIDILNERFGTDFTQADQLFFDQIQEEAIENEDLQKAASANSKDDFRYVFEKAFEGLVIDRMEGNEEIFGKLMTDGEFRKLAVEHLLSKVYRALKKSDESEQYQGAL